jgi:hypothetical protein
VFFILVSQNGINSKNNRLIIVVDEKQNRGNNFLA